jgi:hypothetical protein
MYSQSLKAEIDRECGRFERLSLRCMAALKTMSDQLGDFDVYNVYDECGDDQRRRLADESSESEKRSFFDTLLEMSKDSVEVETHHSFKVTAGM